jgi:hypothetical protein
MKRCIIALAVGPKFFDHQARQISKLPGDMHIFNPDQTKRHREMDPWPSKTTRQLKRWIAKESNRYVDCRGRVELLFVGQHWNECVHQMWGKCGLDDMTKPSQYQPRILINRSLINIIDQMSYQRVLQHRDIDSTLWQQESNDIYLYVG